MGHRDNMSDDGDTGGSGLYQVMWSPDLVTDMDQYDLYMEQEIMDMNSLIQQPNNSLNIVIISILLIFGLTNNIVAFPVMLFR